MNKLSIPQSLKTYSKDVPDFSGLRFEFVYLSNMNYFNDFDLYVRDDSGNITHFTTVTEVIASFESYPQDFYEIFVEHEIDATPSKIGQNILSEAIELLDDYKRSLWMLSTCTYHIDCLYRNEREKVRSFIRRRNGKFFFLPEARGEIEEAQCARDKLLAADIY